MARERPPFTLARQLLAAGALLLLVALFLGWYGVDLQAARVQEAERLSDAALSGSRLTGWEAFSAIDVLLAVAAVTGAATGLVPVLRGGAALVPWASGIATGAAGLAALVIVYRIIDQPGPDGVLSLRAGPFVALAGALLMTYGASRTWSGRER